MPRAALLLTVPLLLTSGCWFGAGGAGSASPVAVKRSAQQLVVLDPLDWSGRCLETRGLKIERRDGAVLIEAADAERTADALAGALLALRRRVAVIAENVAAAETSRLPTPGTPEGPPQPYRRKVLAVTDNGALEVRPDASAFRRVYRPNHPDADKDGYVLLPNVYVTVELGDWRASLREYESLRSALAALSNRYAAPPANLLPEPVPPPPYEEKPAPAPTAKPEPRPPTPPAKPEPRPPTPPAP